MSINLFTNLVASYGIYHGLPHLKRIYKNSESSVEGTFSRKAYVFINTHLEPTSISAKYYLDGIEKYQWIAHLIFTALVASGVMPDMKPVRVYGLISFLTITGLKIGGDSALVMTAVNKIKSVVISKLPIFSPKEQVDLIDLGFDD